MDFCPPPFNFTILIRNSVKYNLLTLKLELRDEIGVSSNCVELTLSSQVPHIHRVIITSRSHMVTAEGAREGGRERERERVKTEFITQHTHVKHQGSTKQQEKNVLMPHPYPLGEKSMARTFFRCPSNSRRHFPDLRSHTRPHASMPLEMRV